MWLGIQEFIKKKNIQLKEGNSKAGRADICNRRSKQWFGQGWGWGAASQTHTRSWPSLVTYSSLEASRKGVTAASLVSPSCLPSPTLTPSGGGWGGVISLHPNLEVKVTSKWSSGCFWRGLPRPCWGWPGCSGPRGLTGPLEALPPQPSPLCPHPRLVLSP